MNKFIFLFCIIVPSQLKSQVTQDKNDPIYEAPYYGYFNGFKDGDSLTVQQISTLGPMLCSNNNLEVIGFTFSIWGTCIGGMGIQSEEIIGKDLKEKKSKLIPFLRPGAYIGFQNIRVKNKVGSVYHIRLIHFKVRA